MITDEQAKLGQKALEVLQDFGGFLREMLGTVPEDLVGVLGGDWLKVRRAVNMASMLEKAREKFERRKVEQKEEVSLTIAAPLLRAATDERREEIRELWARLFANAMGPSRSSTKRRSFIDIVQQMEPLEFYRLWQEKIALLTKLSTKPWMTEL